MDDDDDDDDDDDNGNEEKDDGTYMDYIGDIEAKLKGNKLPMTKNKIPKKARDFKLLFDNLQKESEEKDSKNYLQNKRFVAFADRRKNKDENADFYLYEPPKGNSRDIPSDAVPEWGISSSRTCLIPSSEYDEADAIGKPNMGNVSNNKKKNDSNDKTIGAAFAAAGSLLILSFHIRSADLIKVYLYFNGQIVRFLPKDLKALFNGLYNMDYKGNKDYIEKGKIDDKITKMSAKIVDKQFDAWQQEYGITSK